MSKLLPVETPYFLPVGFRGIELFKVEGLGPKCYKYRAVWKSTTQAKLRQADHNALILDI